MPVCTPSAPWPCLKCSLDYSVLLSLIHVYVCLPLQVNYELLKEQELYLNHLCKPRSNCICLIKHFEGMNKLMHMNNLFQPNWSTGSLYLLGIFTLLTSQNSSLPAVAHIEKPHSSFPALSFNPTCTMKFCQVANSNIAPCLLVSGCQSTS